jgi:hypothetical protein
MEAALQLIANLDIETISQQHLKASLKRNPVAVNFAETGLKVFQEHAFQVAYASHMNKIYPEKNSPAAD